MFKAITLIPFASWDRDQILSLISYSGYSGYTPDIVRHIKFLGFNKDKTSAVFYIEYFDVIEDMWDVSKLYVTINSVGELSADF